MQAAAVSVVAPAPVLHVLACDRLGQLDDFHIQWNACPRVGEGAIRDPLPSARIPRPDFIVLGSSKVENPFA